MYHSIISLACYKPRDPWYRGTKVCMGTYRFVEKPGTTDVAGLVVTGLSWVRVSMRIML